MLPDLGKMTSHPLTVASSNVAVTNGGSRGLAEALAGIREVKHKIEVCEAAMEGRGTYLGIRDTVGIYVWKAHFCPRFLEYVDRQRPEHCDVRVGVRPVRPRPDP